MDNNNIGKMVDTLKTSGIIAANAEEATFLTLFRKLPEPLREKYMARIEGCVDAFTFRLQN